MTERSPEEVAAAIAEMNLLIARIAENAATIAHARRSLYLAYLAEGFSEAEALDLCKTLSIT